MELIDNLSYLIHLRFLYPNTVLFPINDVIERKDTVGIDEDGYSAHSQCLIQTLGKIAQPSDTKDIVRLHHIVIELLRQLTSFLFVFSACFIFAPLIEICDKTLVLLNIPERTSPVQSGRIQDIGVVYG